jgi:hypothetical protein
VVALSTSALTIKEIEQDLAEMIISTLAMGGIETIVLIVSWLLLVGAVIAGICLMKSCVRRRSYSELALAQLTDEVRRLQASVAELEKNRN